jgi:hypothetical protein
MIANLHRQVRAYIVSNIPRHIHKKDATCKKCLLIARQAIIILVYRLHYKVTIPSKLQQPNVTGVRWTRWHVHSAPDDTKMW